MIGPLLFNALLAATYPLSKYVLNYGPLSLLVTIRMLIAGTIFLSYYFCFHKNNTIVLLPFLPLAFGTMYIPFMIEAWALQKVTALQVNGMYLLNPLVCATLEYWLAGQFLGKKRLAALIIGFGASLLFLSSNTTTHVSLLPSKIELAVLISLLISMCIATYSWLAIKKLLKKNYSLFYINGMIMFFAGLMSFVTFIFGTIFLSTSIICWQKMFLYGSILAVIGNIVGFGLLTFLLRRYSLTFIALAQGTMPLFGAFYQYLFTGTFINFQELFSLGFIMVSIFLFYSQEQDNSHLTLSPPVA